MKLPRNEKCILGVVLAAVLLLAAPRAGAISIALAPPTVEVGIGVSFGLNVVVSGLGDGSAPSLGSYDLDLHFDPAYLAFDIVQYGSFLGHPANSVGSVLTAPGLVDFYEVSLLLPNELDALQPDSFSVATVYFTALAPGTSDVDFGAVLAGDGFAVRLPIESLSSSVVAAVPEPTGALVFALGAGVLAWSRRRGT